MSNQNVEGKRILVTGAAGGLGTPTVNALTEGGAEVIATSRNTARLEQTFGQNPNVRPLELDLASSRSIGKAAEELNKLGSLDAIVLNASIWAPKGSKTEDGRDGTFGVNFLGNYEFLAQILHLTKQVPVSKIVIVSSLLYMLGNIKPEDLDYTQRPNRAEASRYADSKLALQYLANYLNYAVLPTHDNISSAVVAIPQMGKSGIFENSTGPMAKMLNRAMSAANPSPEDGARPIIRATSGYHPRGSIVYESGAVEPSEKVFRATNKSLTRELIAAAEEITGQKLR